MVRRADHKPEEAGLCAFVVTDLDGMRAELDNRGLDLGGIRVDGWDGRKYRVCFLREPKNSGYFGVIAKLITGDTLSQFLGGKLRASPE